MTLGRQGIVPSIYSQFWRMVMGFCPFISGEEAWVGIRKVFSGFDVRALCRTNHVFIEIYHPLYDKYSTNILSGYYKKVNWYMEWYLYQFQTIEFWNETMLKSGLSIYSDEMSENPFLHPLSHISPTFVLFLSSTVCLCQLGNGYITKSALICCIKLDLRDQAHGI